MNQKSFFSVAATVCLSLIILAVFVVSCGRKKTVGEPVAKPLVVAMELQFPPFEMADEKGAPRGISVDTAYALGKFLGREVEIRNTSWTGLIPSLQSGKVDVVISSMSITEERRKVIDFSVPYAQSGLTLLLYKKSAVKGFADLNHKDVTIAVKSGTTGAIFAAANLKTAKVRLFDEVAACVLEVSQGKADAFIYDALTTYESQKKFPDTTHVNLKNLPGTGGYWGMAFKKGNDELREQANAFILEYRDSGGFEKLEDKYLGELKAVFEASGAPSFLDIKEN